MAAESDARKRPIAEVANSIVARGLYPCFERRIHFVKSSSRIQVQSFPQERDQNTGECFSLNEADQAVFERHDLKDVLSIEDTR